LASRRFQCRENVGTIIARFMDHGHLTGTAILCELDQYWSLRDVRSRGAEVVAAALVFTQCHCSVGRRNQGNFCTGEHIDCSSCMAGIGGADHDICLGGHQFPGLSGSIFIDLFRQQLNRLAFMAACSVDLLDRKPGGRPL
jgi:hypothetical protein